MGNCACCFNGLVVVLRQLKTFCVRFFLASSPVLVSKDCCESSMSERSVCRAYFSDTVYVLDLLKKLCSLSSLYTNELAPMRPMFCFVDDIDYDDTGSEYDCDKVSTLVIDKINTATYLSDRSQVYT